MIIRVLLFVFLLFPLLSSAQDIIIGHDSTRTVAKVLEISATEIRYKDYDNVNGPTIVLERAKVYKIVYPNGKESVMAETNTGTPAEYIPEKDQHRGGIPDTDYSRRTTEERTKRFEAGRLEATRFYTGSGPMVGTFLATFLGAGIIGLAVGGIAFATPPDVDMYQTSRESHKKDPDFRAGYQQEAHKMKKKKVAIGFGIGLIAFAALVSASQ